MRGVAAVNAHNATQEAGGSSTSVAILEGTWKSNVTSIPRLNVSPALKNTLLWRIVDYGGDHMDVRKTCHELQSITLSLYNAGLTG